MITIYASPLNGNATAKMIAAMEVTRRTALKLNVLLCKSNVEMVIVYIVLKNVMER